MYLKPFEAIQRVRPPPGRGAARQPEASLAWAAATSLVKRRQRMLKPCVSLDIMYPLRPSVWVDRGAGVPVGPRGVNRGRGSAGGEARRLGTAVVLVGRQRSERHVGLS